MDDNKKLAKKGAIIYTVIVIAVTYAYVAWLYFSGLYKDANVYTVALSGMMFIPAICSIITRLVTKEKFKDMRLRPNFKGNALNYLTAWLFPVVLTVLGAVVYFIIFPKFYDANMSYYLSELGKASPDAASQMASVPVSGFLFYQVGMALFVGLFNILPAFGEELGWRGYLFPKLLKCGSPVFALLVSGAIWGLWHAPVIALGHNYGTEYVGYPWLGIITMTVSCMGFGVILCYLSFKAKSVWPAALGHGILNAVAAAGVLLTTADSITVLGPLPLSLIGGVPIYIVAAIILVKARDIFAEKTEETPEELPLEQD